MSLLKWLKRFASGEQSAVPAELVTERDDQGRVTMIQQRFGPVAIASEQLAIATGAALDTPIDEACAWLNERNFELAHDYRIGLETKFLFKQDTGTLRLSFPGRTTLVARAQVLGTFDPNDGSFLWAWNNPSLAAEWRLEIETVRDLFDREPAFTVPKQVIRFDDLTPILSLACKAIGADGVYRCVGASSSLFLAIRVKPEDARKGEWDSATQAAIDGACDLVSAYDAEMLPLDERYEDGASEDYAAMKAMLEDKKAIRDRYWRAEDVSWEPRSFSWPSDHDPAERKLRFAVPDHQGGALCVTVRRNERDVHRVRLIDGELKIVDRLLEWGQGFVWPERKAR